MSVLSGTLANLLLVRNFFLLLPPSSLLSSQVPIPRLRSCDDDGEGEKMEEGESGQRLSLSLADTHTNGHLHPKNKRPSPCAHAVARFSPAIAVPFLFFCGL